MHLLKTSKNLTDRRPFCVVIGSALLALTAACSGDLDEGSLELEAELEGSVTDVTDVDDIFSLAADATVTKARFNLTATYNGFPVGCDGTRIQIIRPAQTRAEQILDKTIAATDAAWSESLFSAPPYSTLTTRFRNIFNANSSDPYYFVATAFNMAEKLRNIRAVINTTYHTCHDDNESVGIFNGVYRTCAQTQAYAVTSASGGADNPIRWCEVGLDQPQDDAAITMVHELTHQDRTNDSTGTHVGDNNNNGVAYNAHNIDRWLRENR